MEAKTVDGKTTVIMTDTEADELFHELGELGGANVSGDSLFSLYMILLDDGREKDW
jgi:hypothetical protein